MTAWISIASKSTRQKREDLADQIASISDEQLRSSLRQAMSGLFRSFESDLERNCVGGKR
jgi:hypothetical protein